MKRSHEILTLSTAIAMLLASSAWAGNGPNKSNNSQNRSLAGTCVTDSTNTCLAESRADNSKNWRNNYQQGSQANCTDENCSSLELAEISEAEAITLAFMREEEKMARDVYITLYETWQTPLFVNISKAEQQHMDQIKALLDSYELPDPATEEVGVFTNSDIQALYDSLIERGSISQIEALQVGALVEEVDIADLEKAIAETENSALERMYTNLMNGSYNHLRGFVRNIEYLDYTYQVQHLPQETVDDILNPAAVSRGIGINANDSRMVATGAQFKPLIQNQNGRYNNGAVLAKDDDVTLGTTFQPDTTHIGQQVDLLTVATFTPAGSDKQGMYMRDKTGNWQQWDGDLNNAVASQTQQRLNANQNVNIYQGKLPAGRYQVSTGYRLQDGISILNGQPMDFSVE
ncbi:MAG: DUF2202 domain-containing protein [Candidatus Marithrix sp.]|nr:DUF2202 domain-containing protein [Candidatus Marithrix sp.]